MNAFKTIDLETYPRSTTFNAFKDHDIPVINTTSLIDITHLKALSQESGISTFVLLSYCTGKVLNKIANFRQRIVNEQLVEFAHIDPGYTVLLEDNTFTFCDSQYTPELAEFARMTKRNIEAVKLKPDLDMRDKDDMFFISSIPWFAFTSFSHPYMKRYASIPIVTFGKFYNDADRTMVPVAIQAHHALVDGFHIGLFYQKLSRQVQDLECVSDL